MTILGKTLVMSAVAAALTITSMSAASADEYWRHHNRDGWAFGAAGLATGLIVGSAIASQPRYVEPAPAYVDPGYDAPPLATTIAQHRAASMSNATSAIMRQRRHTVCVLGRPHGCAIATTATEASMAAPAPMSALTACAISARPIDSRRAPNDNARNQGAASERRLIDAE